MFIKRNAFILKIVILVLLFSLLPMLLMNGTWHLTFRRVQKEEVLTNSESLMTQMEGQLNNYKEILNQNSETLITDSQIKYYLESQIAITDQEKEKRESYIEDKIFNAASYTTFISSIDVISQNYCVGSRRDGGRAAREIQNMKCYQDFVRYGKQWELILIDDLHGEDGSKGARLCYMQRILSSYGSWTIGAVVYSLNISEIKNMISRETTESKDLWFIFDEMGNAVYTREGAMLSDNLPEEGGRLLEEMASGRESDQYIYQDEEYITLCEKIESMNWYLVKLVNKKEMFSFARWMAGRLTVGMLLLSLAAAICSFFFIYRMLHPVREITDYMEKIANDHFDVRFTDVSEDEFGRIKGGFNRMIDHITELMDQISRQEAEKRDIEIKVLQAQITPHFLYNTLNIIRWRAVMAGNAVVGKMIVTLIKTMEFNGKRKEEFVTIYNEIDHIRNYVQLMLYHYEDKFEVSYEVGEEVFSLYIFKLVLQPLVENAIYHGVLPLEKKGVIRIKASRQGERVFFEVEDNGVGMDQETLDGIQDGIGFSNVNERLKYYYGEEYRLHVESRPEKGTRVYFYIPAVESITGQKSVLGHSEEKRGTTV